MLKASVVNAAPFMPVNHAPLIKITKAVMVHTINVSIRGSSIEIDPCLMGLLVFAAACAIGELPNPASFEKTPRETPNLIAIITVAPANPPEAAVVLKAESIISIKTSGINAALITIIYIPPRI